MSQREKVKVNPLFKVPVHERRLLALSIGPIYGGTTPETKPEEKPETKTTQQSTTTTPTTTTAPNPLEDLQKDPAKLQQLLSQVTTLTTSQQALQAELDGYKTKEQEAENAKKTKEEQLQTTIDQKDAMLAKAQNLLHQKALENALLTHSDYQWHDVKDALRNILETGEVTVTVDIDKQQAEVAGLEKALKALATTKAWMLKSGPGTQQQSTQQQTVTNPALTTTGAPPAPPSNDAAKQARRAALIKKHPVIAH